MISFDDIKDALVRRMVARIRVTPFWATNGPYLAELRLVRSGARAASGHPVKLWATALTPSDAVEQLLAMIYVWMGDPTSTSLVEATDEYERHVVVEAAPATYGRRSINRNA